MQVKEKYLNTRIPYQLKSDDDIVLSEMPGSVANEIIHRHEALYLYKDHILVNDRMIFSNDYLDITDEDEKYDASKPVNKRRRTKRAQAAPKKPPHFEEMKKESEIEDAQ